MVGRCVRGASARAAAVVVFLGLALPGRPVHAQRVAEAASPSAVEVKQRVTVHFDNASLRVVLDAIAQEAGLKPSYDVAVIPSLARVTIHATNMPVGEAFAYVLRGTGLNARIQATGNVVIFSSGANAAVNGALLGAVTDAKTRKPVANAVATVDQRTAGVRTGPAGTFRIADLTAGEHLVTIRAIGYARVTRAVTVVDDSTIHLDIALHSTTNVLDQVVVTATGEQRYRELGHVVAKLNVDSLVKNAPITNVAELLTARVPGLQVVTQNGGMAGGEIALRLRGQTTAYLDPQPIVIVDGVRYKNTNAVVRGNNTVIDEDQRPFNAEERSPLNDLNVNNIETIEIVKGPSASTLYGPDAANGVIVITTKRAKAGKTEWHVYAHPRLSSISGGGNGTAPQRGYWAWGHDPNTGQPVSFSCRLADEYYGACVQDSITLAPTESSLPDYSVVAKDRPSWQYGADVGGGSDALRYFVSAGYDSQTGSLQIAPAAERVLKQGLGVPSLPPSIRNPNTQQTVDLHSNLAATPRPDATISLITSYSQTSQRSIDPAIYTSRIGYGAVQPGCSTTDLTNPCAPLDQGNASIYLQTSQQHVTRFTGSVNGVVQVTSWLNANATVGIDLAGSVDRGIRPNGGQGSFDGGQASDYRRDNTGRTATINATASAHPGRFSFRTSLGTQYTYAHLDGLNTTGLNLAPGSTSISTATYTYDEQLWSETVSLGTYGEEVVGLNDRLFLTGALRLDGSTSFGDAYRPRPYPKVGLSWIASEEPWLPRVPGVDELRLRYSFGAASRYPTSAMKLGMVTSYQDIIENQNQNLYFRGQLGNPLLRPERTRESEYGADATLWKNRVTVGLTWYQRRTADQLQGLLNPEGLPTQWTNVGTVAAHGFEATLDARLFETRSMQGSVQLSYTYQRDKVLSLGAAANAGNCYNCFQVGYPFGAIFSRPIIGIEDTVGGHADGVILDSREWVLDSVSRYIGVIYPPHTVMLTPSLTMFGGRIRLSTSLDRQTGFVVVNNVFNNGQGTELAVLEHGSSTLAQARYLSGIAGYVPGDFTRWREATLSTDLPTRLMHLLLMSRGTVNFQVRNLALWTRYKGGDPESQPNSGTTGQFYASTGAIGVPLARAWSISFDVTP